MFPKGCFPRTDEVYNNLTHVEIRYKLDSFKGTDSVEVPCRFFSFLALRATNMVWNKIRLYHSLHLSVAVRLIPCDNEMGIAKGIF